MTTVEQRVGGIIRLLFCLFVICAASASGQEPTPAINWTDVTRDVFIGGQVDRTIQMLYTETPKRMALVGPNLDRTIVLDLTDNLVGALPKAALTIAADRTSATSSASESAEILGMLTVVDETTYSFDFEGKSFLIMRHKG